MDRKSFSLPDAQLHYLPHWLDDATADALFDALLATIPWQHHRLRLFGREVDAPRLSCWIGDLGAAYTYSRTRFEPHPWTPELLSIRQKLRTEFGVDFNGVLANLYRDGNDSMGRHADDEPEIDVRAPIVSLSLGETRRFLIRHRTDPAHRLAINLAHGSLLAMGDGMQAHYRHALPKTARAVGARINLTFRVLVGSELSPPP